jgi:hypothetical protein
MVAINSIPQHEVANGKGHIEFLRARPTTLLSCVVKKPSPVNPGGASIAPTASAVEAKIGEVLNRTGRAIVFILKLIFPSKCTLFDNVNKAN